MANALIDIPKSARKGDIITLRALVSHQMETAIAERFPAP